MKKLFDINGLMFFTGQEIALRRHLSEQFASEIATMLRAENRAWDFHEIEAPILTPVGLINPNYTADEVWFQQGDEALVLRPETTPGSYLYASHLLESHSGTRPPFCVWQVGKSFRREQDQVSKNVRLKEFYQQEFQCFFTADTKNDYQSAVLEPLRKMFARHVGLPARLVDSERLPSYSRRTVDVELDNGDKWMEVCSVSLRTDFATKANLGQLPKDILVLEIAVGLDRCVYNLQQGWMAAEKAGAR